MLKLLSYTINHDSDFTTIHIVTDNVYGLSIGDYVKLHKTSIIGDEDVAIFIGKGVPPLKCIAISASRSSSSVIFTSGFK